MTRLKALIHRWRERSRLPEQMHEAKLEDAERLLAQLQERSEAAHKTLSERDQRNHWQESIRDMILGAY